MSRQRTGCQNLNCRRWRNELTRPNEGMASDSCCADCFLGRGWLDSLETVMSFYEYLRYWASRFTYYAADVFWLVIVGSVVILVLVWGAP